MIFNASFIDYSSFFSCEYLKAGFSLKSENINVVNDRKILARLLGLNPEMIVIPRQKHTNNVRLVQEPGCLENTDGIVAVNKALVLSIQVADCIPLFLFDPVKPIIGLIHAGWRGIASEIGIKALNIFIKLGSRIEDILVLMGPCIHQCCFEVNTEVAEKFPPEFSYPSNGKYFLDITAAMKEQLVRIGILNRHLEIADECTCCDTEHFFSYRREGERAGRMVAIFGWM
ncbi:MAG: peptidoglycan editing factor PgeF [Fidelibacterota bacterium]